MTAADFHVDFHFFFLNQKCKQTAVGSESLIRRRKIVHNTASATPMMTQNTHKKGGRRRKAGAWHETAGRRRNAETWQLATQFLSRVSLPLRFKGCRETIKNNMKKKQTETNKRQRASVNSHPPTHPPNTSATFRTTPKLTTNKTTLRSVAGVVNQPPSPWLVLRHDRDAWSMVND